MSFRISTRTSASALALLAAGWITVAAPGQALANGTDDSNQAAVAAMPHSHPIRNGTPEVSTTADGKPDISYTGLAHGNLSPGVPHLAGQTANGSPIITYTPRTHHRAATRSAVSVDAAATPDGMTAPAEPTDARMLLDQARQALQARRMDQARDRLERAETALLNARVDGEQGDAGTLRDIASARAAVALNNQGAALRDLGQVMKALDNPMG